MVWCGSKSGHHKDMYLNEIGLCAQNDDHSRSTVNEIRAGGGLPFNEHKNLHFEKYEKSSYVLYGFAKHLVLIGYFIF